MFNLNTFDAQAALGFVVSQRSHIETQVHQQIYPAIQFPFLVPVDSSAHPFAKTVTFYSGDIYGAAKWINGNADNVPLAGSEMTKFESSIHTAGVGYGFGWEEIGAAMQMGYNLPAADAIAARRAYMEFVDNVAIRGDATKNMFGLINFPSVTPVAALTGGWASATDAQIIADFNQGIRASWSGTRFTSLADTVLMSNEKVDFLNTRVLPGTTTTLMGFLKANNTYTNETGKQLTVRGVRGLETAGAGSVQRMVAYRRSDDVLKLHMPMAHRFLQPYAAGPLRTEVPGVFRLGGADARLPAEIRYIDGI